MIRNLSWLSVLGLLLLFGGCGQAPPEIVPTGGVVTINGKPLANAEVSFVPMQDGLDGNYTARGFSDGQGKFKLKLPGKEESGCCACECKVLIVEGPEPDGAREQSARGEKMARAYRKSLKNRPIPSQYERVGTTPLTVTVSAENNDFKLDLERVER